MTLLCALQIALSEGYRECRLLSDNCANLSANADFNHLPEVKLKLCWKTHAFLLSNKKPALGGLLFKPFFMKFLSQSINASLRHEDAP